MELFDAMTYDLENFTVIPLPVSQLIKPANFTISLSIFSW